MNKKSAWNSSSKNMFVWFLFFMAFAAIVVSPFIGIVNVTLSQVFQPEGGIDQKIFWSIRAPRVAVGFIAGAMFALCGMVFQAMFRNPLVAPSTLGVSIGASLGAAVYIWLGMTFHFIGISGITAFAFAGALLAIFIVWKLARVDYGTSTAKMLLAGIAVSFFFGSLIMLLQFLSDISQSFRITRWLMGGLFVYGWEPLQQLLPFAVIGTLVIWYFTHELNLLTTGEEIAVSRGVDVQRLNKILFIVVSFIIGGVVSVCGPISFIGIIAPHMARLLIGSDHRYLMPATALVGGTLLLVCDTLARTLFAPAEIPVGVITAILGGPFFLWLLQKRFQ